MVPWLRLKLHSETVGLVSTLMGRVLSRIMCSRCYDQVHIYLYGESKYGTLSKSAPCCLWLGTTWRLCDITLIHYGDVTMGAIASQITNLTVVYSTVYSDADQRKHQSSASLAFVRGIHRGPVNSPHKWPVTRKIFLFDDVTMTCMSISDLI